MIFIDPNGVFILNDSGRSGAGTCDPQLGKINILLVSQTHGDHACNKDTKTANTRTCGKPNILIVAAPNSNAGNIAFAKKTKIFTGVEMPAFF